MGRGKQIAKWMPIDKITPWDKNPRHNAEAVEPLAKAILRFGFDQPIVVWGSQNNRIVKGHTRRLALLWLFDKVPERAEDGTITGWRTRGEDDEPFVLQGAPGPGSVPVEVREYDSEEHYRAATVSDNRLGELAQWDDQGLQEILGSIEAPELIDGLGWEADELEDLIQVTGHQRSPSSPSSQEGNAAPESSSQEIDPDAFELAHECPRCGMQFNDPT